MKSTYENKNSGAKPTHEALLNNALKAAQGKPIQTFPKSEGGLLMADERAQLPADPEQVMNQIDKTQKAFKMSLRFFAWQVATSSVSNILGTVLGHPLDTIRVSLSTLFHSPIQTIKTSLPD